MMDLRIGPVLGRFDQVRELARMWTSDAMTAGATAAAS
jgi:hypothetical protein